MAEYIDRQTVLDLVLKSEDGAIVDYEKRNWRPAADVYKLAGEIADIPTADVAPVVHAHWRDKRLINTANCSRCGRVHESRLRQHNPEYSRNFNDWDAFCPECGAKMDEEVRP